MFVKIKSKIEKQGNKIDIKQSLYLILLLYFINNFKNMSETQGWDLDLTREQ